MNAERSSEAAGACPLCGVAESTPVFTTPASAYDVVACSVCGLTRTVAYPSDEVLRATYVADYRTATGRKFRRPIEAVRRLFARALALRVARRVGAPRGSTGEAAGPSADHPRVLDIGCGDGKVLRALAARGFECVGVELDAYMFAALSPASGVHVHVGPLEELQLPSSSFRVIVLRHVLEHLRDPVRTLVEIRRLLTPDGVLIVAVPNLASWQARVAGARWFHLDLPRHLFHFTPATLTAALSHAGLTVERIDHFSFEQNPYGWVQSIFNLRGGRWGGLYRQSRASASAAGRGWDLIVVAIALALTPVALVLSLAESVARRGGTIEVWASPASGKTACTPRPSQAKLGDLVDHRGTIT